MIWIKFYMCKFAMSYSIRFQKQKKKQSINNKIISPVYFREGSYSSVCMNFMIRLSWRFEYSSQLEATDHILPTQVYEFHD